MAHFSKGDLAAWKLPIAITVLVEVIDVSTLHRQDQKCRVRPIAGSGSHWIDAYRLRPMNKRETKVATKCLQIKLTD